MSEEKELKGAYNAHPTDNPHTILYDPAYAQPSSHSQYYEDLSSINHDRMRPPNDMYQLVAAGETNVNFNYNPQQQFQQHQQQFVDTESPSYFMENHAANHEYQSNQHLYMPNGQSQRIRPDMYANNAVPGYSMDQPQQHISVPVSSTSLEHQHQQHQVYQQYATPANYGHGYDDGRYEHYQQIPPPQVIQQGVSSMSHYQQATPIQTPLPVGGYSPNTIHYQNYPQYLPQRHVSLSHQIPRLPPNRSPQPKQIPHYKPLAPHSSSRMNSSHHYSSHSERPKKSHSSHRQRTKAPPTPVTYPTFYQPYIPQGSYGFSREYHYFYLGDNEDSDDDEGEIVEIPVAGPPNQSTAKFRRVKRTKEELEAEEAERRKKKELCDEDPEFQRLLADYQFSQIVHFNPKKAKMLISRGVIPRYDPLFPQGDEVLSNFPPVRRELPVNLKPKKHILKPLKASDPSSESRGGSGGLLAAPSSGSSTGCSDTPLRSSERYKTNSKSGSKPGRQDGRPLEPGPKLQRDFYHPGEPEVPFEHREFPGSRQKLPMLDASNGAFLAEPPSPRYKSTSPLMSHSYDASGFNNAVLNSINAGRQVSPHEPSLYPHEDYLIMEEGLLPTPPLQQQPLPNDEGFIYKKAVTHVHPFHAPMIVGHSNYEMDNKHRYYSPRGQGMDDYQIFNDSYQRPAVRQPIISITRKSNPHLKVTGASRNSSNSRRKKLNTKKYPFRSMKRIYTGIDGVNKIDGVDVPQSPRPTNNGRKARLQVHFRQSHPMNHITILQALWRVARMKKTKESLKTTASAVEKNTCRPPPPYSKVVPRGHKSILSTPLFNDGLGEKVNICVPIKHRMPIVSTQCKVHLRPVDAVKTRIPALYSGISSTATEDTIVNIGTGFVDSYEWLEEPVPVDRSHLLGYLKDYLTDVTKKYPIYVPESIKNIPVDTLVNDDDLFGDTVHPNTSPLNKAGFLGKNGIVQMNYGNENGQGMNPHYPNGHPHQYPPPHPSQYQQQQHQQQQQQQHQSHQMHPTQQHPHQVRFDSTVNQYPSDIPYTNHTVVSEPSKMRSSSLKKKGVTKQRPQVPKVSTKSRHRRRSSSRTFEALSSGPLPISLDTPSTTSNRTNGNNPNENHDRPPGGWFWALFSADGLELGDEDDDSDDIRDRYGRNSSDDGFGDSNSDNETISPTKRTDPSSDDPNFNNDEPYDDDERRYGRRHGKRRQRRRKMSDVDESAYPEENDTPPALIPIQLTQPPLCNILPSFPQALESDPLPRTRKQSKYTPEQDQQILKLKNQGNTWAEIAQRTGCQNQLAARNRYQVLIGQQGGGAYAWTTRECAFLQVKLDDGERAKWLFIAEELSRKFDRHFPFEAVFYRVCKFFAKKPERFGLIKTRDSTQGGTAFKRRELFDMAKADQRNLYNSMRREMDRRNAEQQDQVSPPDIQGWQDHEMMHNQFDVNMDDEKQGYSSDEE